MKVNTIVCVYFIVMCDAYLQRQQLCSQLKPKDIAIAQFL